MKRQLLLTLSALIGIASSMYGQLYVNFNVTQAPALVAAAGPDHNVCRVDTVQLGGSPSASGGTVGYQYSWSTTGAISSTTDPNPMGNTNVTTDYILTVTDTNNCTSIDTATVNISPCTGVQEWKLPLEVTVSPNPGDGLFTVRLSGTYNRNIVMTVRNSLGQVVRSEELGKITNQLSVSLDLTKESKGIYTLDLAGRKEHSITKLIVQ